MELPEKSNLPAPPQPSRTSFSSLPEDIVLIILGRVSTSHYPKLSCVSKSFHSLILSKDLKHARSRNKTRENRVYVCLQSLIHPCNHRWFSLWIKPDDHQTLTHPCNDRWVGFWTDPDQHQTLACCMSEDKTTRNLLVPIPSSYSPYLPKLYEMAGSDIYAIGGGLNPSSSTTVHVCNELVGKWREAPSMMVARKNAFTCSLNGKIYVMGGCESDESECWAEVFDPNTQTWEPLPDPGTRLRFSSIKNLDAQADRIYLRTNKKNFVYLTEEKRWEVVDENIGESECRVENTWYCYANGLHWWHDTKYCKEWRLVKGLTELDLHFRRGHGMEIVSYGRKLLIFWVGSAEMLDDFPLSLASDDIWFSEIWCAVVLLERRHDDEVWGQIEWVDPVLRVPSLHTLLRCVELLQ
ncbi:F-box/kelch-repeat protein [Hirschfeldia incana]|nr:F-box/kelch-repeat protein [Hirschfeldia incana]